MPLTVTQGEGLTVITVTSDPKSKWPALCQIVGYMCFSPVCVVSQVRSSKVTNVNTALGSLQILYGFLSIVLGILFTKNRTWMNITDYGNVFWIGGVAIAIGTMTVLAAEFPSSCLLVIALILNVFSGALAITAAVLSSLDLTSGNYMYRDCSTSHLYSTPSPDEREKAEFCLKYKHLNKLIVGGLDIAMIVLSLLQLSVTISFCVLTGKALRAKDDNGEKVEQDLERYNPLLMDSTVDPEF